MWASSLIFIPYSLRLTIWVLTARWRAMDWSCKTASFVFRHSDLAPLSSELMLDMMVQPKLQQSTPTQSESDENLEIMCEMVIVLHIKMPWYNPQISPDKATALQRYRPIEGSCDVSVLQLNIMTLHNVYNLNEVSGTVGPSTITFNKGVYERDINNINISDF